MAHTQASLHAVVRPSLQSSSAARSTKELASQHGQILRTTLCNKVDPILLSCSRGSLQGGAHQFLTRASSGTPGRRGANLRGPIVAETSGNHSTGLGGTILSVKM